MEYIFRAELVHVDLSKSVDERLWKAFSTSTLSKRILTSKHSTSSLNFKVHSQLRNIDLHNIMLCIHVKSEKRAFIGIRIRLYTLYNSLSKYNIWVK